jgi:hypothetical protein
MLENKQRRSIPETSTQFVDNNPDPDKDTKAFDVICSAKLRISGGVGDAGVETPTLVWRGRP